MVNIVENAQRSAKIDVPAEFLKGKRHLTAQEIKVLEANLNHNCPCKIVSDSTEKNQRYIMSFA